MKVVGIPEPSQPMSASQWIASLGFRQNDVLHRDAQGVEAILQGNVPSRLREFFDVKFSFDDHQGHRHDVIVHVLSDVLSVGTDDDFLRLPLTPMASQKVADAWHCMMITTMLSDRVWQAADHKIKVQAWGAPYGAEMSSMSRFIRYNDRIEASIKSAGIGSTDLVVGHKKDVVLSNQLLARPTMVAIYGWHGLDGLPTQPLMVGHNNVYLDYSHGTRLVARECTVDGRIMDLGAVVKDPILWPGVSREGPMMLLRPPGT